MKIVKAYPPNYELIIISGLKPNDETTFCYGDTIYNPSGKEIRADIELHEEVHSKQQGDDPELWWNQYLTNKDFRLDQEAQAYSQQYAFVKRHIKNNQLLKWALEKMAFALSGQEYGNLISYGKAEALIRNYKK